jgi:phage FluMu protein Com
MEQRCPRCNKTVKEFGTETSVCDRCRDVVEFGYPSFEAYQLEDSQNGDNPQRMDISEGWLLPAYFTAIRK